MSRNIFITWGSYGDVHVSWEEQNDDKVLPAIQTMLDRGVVFFILKKKVIGAGDKRIPATNMAAVKAARKIVLPDDALESLHASGLIIAGSVVLDDEIANTGEIARTAKEVVENTTVATPMAKGG